MDLKTWNPAETNGESEDWLDALMATAGSQRVLQTPTGVVFTRADDVQALLKHEDLKVPVVEQYELLNITGPLLERAKRVILGLDGPPHARLRNLVNRTFTPRAVGGLSAGMQAYLGERLDAIDGRVDFLHDVVDGYPAAVIGSLLGVPSSDLPRLVELADAITSAQFSANAANFEVLAGAAVECDEYLSGLIASKRAMPGDDLLSQLTQLEIDGDQLLDIEILSIASSVLNAGIDTTRNQACLAMTLFAEHPDEWTKVRNEPELADNAVEEVLRFRPVTPLLTRLNTQPFSFADVELPARTLISLAVAAANRDPELNPSDPGRFDVARPAPRHFTFGFGAHYCLGAALARLELVEFLRAMAQRFARIDVVGPVLRRPVMGVYGVRCLTLELTPA